MNIFIGIVLVIFILTFLSKRGRLTRKQVEELQSRNPGIIDVRSKGEFNSYHIEGAINIPHTEITKGIKRYKLKKDRAIILYCASGARSSAALNTLRSLGYTDIHNGGSLGQLERLLK